MTGRRRVRVVPAVSMAEKVRVALTALVIEPEDTAMAELAVQLAETIDRAAVLSRALAEVPTDASTAAVVDRLRSRVSAHQVMVDLGPKLQAALAELGATPRSRALVGKPAASPVKSRLSALREGSAS